MKKHNGQQESRECVVCGEELKWTATREWQGWWCSKCGWFEEENDTEDD